MKILVYGAGKVTRTILKKMNHTKFTVIENDEEKSQKIASLFPHTTIIEGDCLNPDVVHNAGLDKADVVIAATNSNSTNIAASVYARRFVQNVLCVITDEAFSNILEQVDIQPIQPNETAGNACVSYLKYPLIYDLILDDDENYKIMEVNISDDFEPITLNNIHKENGLVAAIYRKKNFLKLDGDTIIKPGDRVLVIFDVNNHEKVFKFWKIKD